MLVVPQLTSASYQGNKNQKTPTTLHAHSWQSLGHCYPVVLGSVRIAFYKKECAHIMGEGWLLL
jgi:hypothetical protein